MGCLPKKTFSKSASRRGSFSLEAAVFFVAVLGCTVLLTRYIHRGAMGNFHSSAVGMGDQFDPRDTFTETHSSWVGDVVTRADATAMQNAPLYLASADQWVAEFMGVPVDISDIAAPYDVPREPAAFGQVMSLDDWGNSSKTEYIDDR